MPTPPLGYPVKEKVVLDVLDTLKGVTLSNGSSINISDTRRPEKQGVKQPDGGVMVEAAEAADDLKDPQPHGYEDRDLTIRLTFTFNKAQSNVTAAANTMKNLIHAAVMRALLVDATRNDNAIWTYVDNARDRDDGETGCTMDVRCHYRTVYGNPFNG